MVRFDTNHAVLGRNEPGRVADDVLLDVHFRAVGEAHVILVLGVLLDGPFLDAVGSGMNVKKSLAVDGGQDFKSAASAVIKHPHDHAGLIAVGIGVNDSRLIGLVFENATDRAVRFGVKGELKCFLY